MASMLLLTLATTAALWQVTLTLCHVNIPFGPEAYDKRFPNIDEFPNSDDHALSVPLTCSYKYFNTKYMDLYIGSNGYVTFGAPFTSFVPKKLCKSPLPMIAPLWSDVFLDNEGALFYRESTNTTLLSSLSNIIDSFFNEACGCNFDAKCAFVATWTNVTSFCDTFGVSRRVADGEDESSMKNDTDTNPAQRLFSDLRNTFQMVFVTDDARRSYVIFFYEELQWDFCFDYNRAGFSPGAGFDQVDTRCFELPGSGTDNVNWLVERSNVGVPGVFMYEVDGSRSNLQLKNPDCEKIGNCCGSHAPTPPRRRGRRD